jgi:hypothetical protein
MGLVWPEQAVPNHPATASFWCSAIRIREAHRDGCLGEDGEHGVSDRRGEDQNSNLGSPPVQGVKTVLIARNRQVWASGTVLMAISLLAL